MRIEIPMKTTSEANSREHWLKRTKRHTQQQFIVRLAFNQNRYQPTFPCEITLTRISPRKLDCDENLPMSFKYIKDEIGAQLFPEKVVTYKNKNGKVVQNKGHADSDPRVTWKYAQETGKIQAIRIEIQPTA